MTLSNWYHSPYVLEVPPLMDGNEEGKALERGEEDLDDQCKGAERRPVQSLSIRISCGNTKR